MKISPFLHPALLLSASLCHCLSTAVLATPSHAPACSSTLTIADQLPEITSIASSLNTEPCISTNSNGSFPTNTLSCCINAPQTLTMSNGQDSCALNMTDPNPLAIDENSSCILSAQAVFSAAPSGSYLSTLSFGTYGIAGPPAPTSTLIVNDGYAPDIAQYNKGTGPFHILFSGLSEKMEKACTVVNNTNNLQYTCTIPNNSNECGNNTPCTATLQSTTASCALSFWVDYEQSTPQVNIQSSTCPQATMSAETLTLNPNIGINSDIVIWTITNSNSNAIPSVTFNTPSTAFCAQTGSAPNSITCNIPYSQDKSTSTTLLFTNNTGSSSNALSCQIVFDNTASFSSSTCNPSVSTPLITPTNGPPTATLSFETGIVPNPNEMWLLNVGTDTIFSAVSGASSPVTLSTNLMKSNGQSANASLRLPQSLAEYSSLQITLSSPFNSCQPGLSPCSCTLTFYNGLLDDRKSSCANINVTSQGPVITIGSSGYCPISLSNKSAAHHAANTIGSRTLTFENHCNQDIWFNLVAGTAANPSIGGNAGTVMQAGGTACMIDGQGNECQLSSASANTTGAQCAPPIDITHCDNNSAYTISGGCACPSGTTCRITNMSNSPQTGLCFFDLPSPSGYSESSPHPYHLSAANPPQTPVGGTKTVSIPMYADNPIVFSGGASARLKCDSQGNNCLVGNCNRFNNALGCGYSQGTANYASIAEFTFQSMANDYYDISLINGAHIPMSLSPTNLDLWTSQAPQINGNISVPFGVFCKETGQSAYASNTARGYDGGPPPCVWNFAPPSWTQQEKQWTQNGVGYADPSFLNILPSVPPNSSDACTASTSLCGLSADWLASPPANTTPSALSNLYTPGTFLGVNTATNICSILSNNPGAYTTLSNSDPFYCSITHTDKNTALTLDSLYECIAPTGSGLQNTAPVCGCSTWGEHGLVVDESLNTIPDPFIQYPSFMINSPCTATSSLWMENVLPVVTFIKRACPRAYSYQYDDATSTYQCNNAKASSSSAPAYNTTDYTIRFCPENTAIVAPSSCLLAAPSGLTATSPDGIKTVFSWQGPSAFLDPNALAGCTNPDTNNPLFGYTLYIYDSTAGADDAGYYGYQAMNDAGSSSNTAANSYSGYVSGNNLLTFDNINKSEHYKVLLQIVAPGYTSPPPIVLTELSLPPTKTTAQTCTGLSTPGLLGVTQITTNSALLSWIPSDFTPAGCNPPSGASIVYSIQGIPTGSTLSANTATSSTLFGLLPDTTYATAALPMTVYAQAGALQSASNIFPAFITNQQTPLPCTGLSTPQAQAATSITPSSALLSWTPAQWTPSGCDIPTGALITYTLKNLPNGAQLSPNPPLSGLVTTLMGLQANTLYSPTSAAISLQAQAGSFSSTQSSVPSFSTSNPAALSVLRCEHFDDYTLLLMSAVVEGQCMNPLFENAETQHAIENLAYPESTDYPGQVVRLWPTPMTTAPFSIQLSCNGTPLIASCPSP